MGKHTPGPWVYRENNGRCIGPVSQEDDQSYGMQMAVAYMDAFDFRDDYAANAHLIAAAPELLEAVESMAKAMESWDITYPPEIDALIAKAKGEPHA